MKRQITDPLGNRWDVWEVDPKGLDRSTYDRRSAERPPEGPSPASRERWTPTDVAALHPDLRDGWLCFQSAAERRRFAPIPVRWYELPDNVLRVMLDVATPVTRTGSSAAGSEKSSPRSTAD